MVFTGLREPRLPPRTTNHRSAAGFFETLALWLE
jgi:hypothetical protein